MPDGPYSITGYSSFVHRCGQISYRYGGTQFVFGMADFNDNYTGAATTIGVWKSVDGQNWSEVDAVNRRQCFPQNSGVDPGVDAYNNDTRSAGLCQHPTSSKLIYVAFVNSARHVEISEFNLDTEVWTATGPQEPTLIDMWPGGGITTTWPMVITHDGTNLYLAFTPTPDADDFGGYESRVWYNKLTGAMGGAWGVVQRVPDQPDPCNGGPGPCTFDNLPLSIWSVPGTGRVHLLLRITDQLDEAYLHYWQVGAGATSKILTVAGELPGNNKEWGHNQALAPVDPWRETGGDYTTIQSGADTYMVTMMSLSDVNGAGFRTWSLWLVVAIEGINPTWSMVAIPDGVGVHDGIGVGDFPLRKNPDCAMFIDDGVVRVIYHDGNAGTGNGTMNMMTRTWNPVGGLASASEFWNQWDWQWIRGVDVSSFWIYASTSSGGADPLHYTISALLSGVGPPGPAPPAIIQLAGGGSGIASMFCQTRNPYDDCADFANTRAQAIMDEVNLKLLDGGLTPPWVEMPHNGQRFQEMDSIVLPLDNGVDNEVLVFRVPYGYDGVIMTTSSQFAGSGFISGSGDIEWRIKINSRFLKDQGAININRGNLRHPYPLQGGGYRIRSNNIIRFLVSISPGAGAHLQPGARILCALTGWYYPLGKEPFSEVPSTVTDPVYW